MTVFYVYLNPFFLQIVTSRHIKTENHKNKTAGEKKTKKKMNKKYPKLKIKPCNKHNINKKEKLNFIIYII
jgi:hypothetical protein